MKNALKLAVPLLFLIFGLIARAQVTLQDFSNVNDGGNYTFFYGTWEATGDTGGTGNPNAQFSQGVGSYTITGSNPIIPTDGSTSQLEFFFSSAANIGANQFLSVTSQALALNEATSFAITLKDTNGLTASAAFAAGPAGGGFITQVQTLTFQGGFNSSSIDSLVISGNQLGGTARFNMTFDNIAAVSAVPEPATYAVLFAACCLGFAVWRRSKVAV